MLHQLLDCCEDLKKTKQRYYNEQLTTRYGSYSRSLIAVMTIVRAFWAQNRALCQLFDTCTFPLDGTICFWPVRSRKHFRSTTTGLRYCRSLDNLLKNCR